MEKLVLLLLIFCAFGTKFAKLCFKKGKKKMKKIESLHYNRKVFCKNMNFLVGSYLEPLNAAKMKLTSKNWAGIDVYENYFPDDKYAFLVLQKETEELIWNDPTDLIPKKENLLEYLKRKDNGKWYPLLNLFRTSMIPEVYRYVWEKDYEKYKRILSFGKSLLFIVSENIDVREPGLLDVARDMQDDKSFRRLIDRGATEFQH
jgi:hypothetical protein